MFSFDVALGSESSTKSMMAEGVVQIPPGEEKKTQLLNSQLFVSAYINSYVQGRDNSPHNALGAVYSLGGLCQRRTVSLESGVTVNGMVTTQVRQFCIFFQRLLRENAGEKKSEY